MPVGTQGAVKTLDSADLEKIGAPVILGNTYHLHLRPGEDLIADLGGLHKFIGWNKPILTDSGGFQVFSLGIATPPGGARNDNAQGRLVEIDEEGVTFKSHIDGSTHRFTPESAIETQYKLGADIIMAFDECTPDRASPDYARQAMERTHRWAQRCLEHFKKIINQLINQSTNRQFLFGIIQGGQHRDLREESAKYISSLDFDGIAVGGESIGYNMEATKEILDWIYPYLPTDKPLYAMGVGLDPADLLRVVEQGVDMFDCASPTRLARHGMVFVSPPARGGARGGGSKHRLNIKNAAFTRDTRQIDPTCHCPTCQSYSRAYLHHLFAAQELSALRLASIHNLYFMLELMRQARAAIETNQFEKLKKKWI